ncbi:MAG: phthalate 3,4-dioxygenase, ferredoxin reductase subunit [Mycobacterium sp.]|nr:phthalate 3,4-dioxygenase, ferredoxin reductase subunit [Mycobacterium sp.]
MPNETVVIVGSSVGGVRTAKALRSQGFPGRVVLIGGEARLPYDKPPLSKQFLAGAWDQSRLTMLTADDAGQAGIELRLGCPAERLDVASRVVILADDTHVRYDALVVATGADARPSPWPVASGVHVVRTLDDSRNLAHALAATGRVVVVGGGFIGAEVAATAHAAGREVTIVDPLSAPISRIVGDEVGVMLAGVHARHGVRTRFGLGVESVDGCAGDLRVTLTNGESMRAATVVVGIGATPNDGWLAGSGLLIDDGVVCDEFCRAVDHSDVYAVGDVARWHHPHHREDVRLEHWTNAAEQATCVAHNIAHPDDLHAYAPTEYVWSDQYDWKIQIAGRPNRATLHRVVGEPDDEKPQLAAVFTDESAMLRGAVTVNWPKALMICRRMIGSGSTVADCLAELEGLPQLNAVKPTGR